MGLSISEYKIKTPLSKKDIGKFFVIRDIENTKSLYGDSYNSIIKYYVYNDNCINQKVKILKISNNGFSGTVRIKGYTVRIFCDDLISLNEHRLLKLKRINLK